MGIKDMALAVLYDIDSRIPNLALMKLSAWYGRQGYRVHLSRDAAYIKADLHAGSAIFSSGKAAQKLAALRRIYGDGIDLGGSGFSLEKQLPPEAEASFPDYALYKHRSYALGCLTKGCNKQCAFCVLPRKNGREVRRVASFEDFVPKGQRRVMLLDDNLLSYSGAEDLLGEMISRRLCFPLCLYRRRCSPHIGL